MTSKTNKTSKTSKINLPFLVVLINHHQLGVKPVGQVRNATLQTRPGDPDGVTVDASLGVDLVDFGDWADDEGRGSVFQVHLSK